MSAHGRGRIPAISATRCRRDRGSTGPGVNYERRTSKISSAREEQGRTRAARWFMLLLASLTFYLPALLGPMPKPIPNAQAAPLLQEEQEVPCQFTHSKTLSPTRAEVGDVLDVKVTFDYDCADEVRPIHMVLMVGTSVPERFRDKRALQANLRSELSKVLDEFPL